MPKFFMSIWERILIDLGCFWASRVFSKLRSVWENRRIPWVVKSWCKSELSRKTGSMLTLLFLNLSSRMRIHPNWVIRVIQIIIVVVAKLHALNWKKQRRLSHRRGSGIRGRWRRWESVMRISFSRPVKATMAGAMYACTQEAHTWLVSELSGIAKTVHDSSRCLMDGWSCSLPHSHPHASRCRDKKLVRMYLRVIELRRDVQRRHFRCTLNYWRPENNFALKSFRALGLVRVLFANANIFLTFPIFIGKDCLADVRAIQVNYIDWNLVYFARKQRSKWEARKKQNKCRTKK